MRGGRERLSKTVSGRGRRGRFPLSCSAVAPWAIQVRPQTKMLPFLELSSSLVLRRWAMACSRLSSDFGLYPNASTIVPTT